MLTLIFRNVKNLEDYISYYKKIYGRNPRVTARRCNGVTEFRTKVNLEDRDQ